MGPVGEDERWEAFDPFHDYLAQSFPLACVIFPLCDYSKLRVNISSSLATRVLP